MLIEIKHVAIFLILNAICSALDLKCSIPNCKNQISDWNHIKQQKKYKETIKQKNY